MEFFGKASEISVPRAMLLCATGSLVGLAIAGYGLFTAAGTSTRTVPPEDVAVVNLRPILRSDFIVQLEMATGKRQHTTSYDEQLKVLDEMIREELLVQRALELDFDETDQGARNALVAAISDQAVAEVTSSTPTDQQLLEYFRQNSARYTTEGIMSLRDFVLSAGATTESAARLALQLRNGANPEPLIASGILRESSHQVNEYYFTLDFRLGSPLFTAIRTLRSGSTSEPLLFHDGFHIVQVEKNDVPVPLPFAVARSQVFSDYIENARSRHMDMTLKFLSNRAKILVSTEYSGYKP